MEPADAATAAEGEGRYEAGLIVLPDGSVRGIEQVVRVTIREPGRRAEASAMVGAVRSAFGPTSAQPLPLRVALSTLQASLGVLEEGLRPREQAASVSIEFADGLTVATAMPVETAILVRRDAEIVRAALQRAKGGTLAPQPIEAVPSQDGQALTSIFRYEKRNGRLRRVAAAAEPSES